MSAATTSSSAATERARDAASASTRGTGTSRAADAIAIAILVCVAGASALTVLSAGFSPVQADETVMAWMGKQVAAGRTPYLDFFAFLPPLVPILAGAITAVAGSGVVPLRIVTVLTVMAATPALYLLLRRRGLDVVGATAASAWLPLVALPFLPMASHHWLGLALVLAGALVATSSTRDARQGVLLGLLAAGAALMHQTAGLLLFVIGVIAVWRDRRAAFTAAVAFAAAACGPIVWLASRGALGALVRDVVLWPVRYYRQAGGVNDIGVPEFFFVLPTGLSTSLAGSDGLVVALVLTLVGVTTAYLVLEIVRPSHPHERAPAWRDLALVAGALLLYTRSRADLLHLVLWIPVLLFVAARQLTAVSRPRRVMLRVVLIAGLLVGLARFVVFWFSSPPRFDRLLAMDRQLYRTVHADVLGRFPEVLLERQPVVFLSHAGSMLYLYWSPEYPPADWIQPPSYRLNSTAQYTRLAEFMAQSRVPYVLVPRQYETRFLDEPSAIRDRLRAEFRRIGETPWGSLYRRHEAGRATAAAAS